MIQVGIIATSLPDDLLFFQHNSKKIEWIIIKDALDLRQINGIITFTENPLKLTKMLYKLGLTKVLKEKVSEGIPLWAMGASFILFQKENINNDLALLDITGTKAGYFTGFSAEIYVQALGTKKVRVNFYPTPWIKTIEPHVGVMAMDQDRIVMARQGNILVSVFVPEKGEEALPAYFLEMVSENMNKQSEY